MELYEKINAIKTKDDFVNFIELLIKDYSDNPDEWENQTLDNYFEAMRAWISDMEGYYKNMNHPIPKNINWNFIANIMYAAKVYE